VRKCVLPVVGNSRGVAVADPARLQESSISARLKHPRVVDKVSEAAVAGDSLEDSDLALLLTREIISSRSLRAEPQ
jgi:hypothetical protein